MDFDCYAAHFALGPEAQAEEARRLREDTARNAAKHAEMEAKSVADELERAEKEKVEKELKSATEAKLKEHRRPQQGERVEYQLLRNGPDSPQPWPTDDEVREILRKGTRASGTVYGTHYAIRFTHKQMVHMPVLLADAPGVTAQAELREHNPFASRCTVTSPATLPTQGHAGCSGEGEIRPAAGSFLKDPRRARRVVTEVQVSS